jgi:hypothetical protein
MEFEDNQPTDDEQQRLAAAKKITLQPLHAGITPDPIPDTEIAARSTQETSPNISSDAEDTTASRLVQPSKSALDKQSPSTPSRIQSRSSWPISALTIISMIGATAWLWINAT